MNRIPDAWPTLMRPDVAESYVGGPTAFAILRDKFGLRPTVKQNKLVLYLKARIDAAVTRLDQERGDQY